MHDDGFHKKYLVTSESIYLFWNVFFCQLNFLSLVIIIITHCIIVRNNRLSEDWELSPIPVTTPMTIEMNKP